MAKLKKKSQHRRNRMSTNTTFEQFSTEIFFDIFGYLTGNEIYKSFFGLNHRFNELVYNTPNVHLNLSRTKTKFYRNFRQIFPKQNIVSVVIFYEHIKLLETLFNSIDERRLRSLSILNVSLRAFETRVLEILNIFKYQLISVKIGFSDMHYTGTGVHAAQSFAYLLTELSLLKHLILEYPEGIDPMTYMPSLVVNNTITNLTLSLHDPKRLIPLLYRFECPMELDKVEQLFKLVSSPTLVTLSLFNCERPAVRYPMPKRQSPFLDGTHWHDLLKKYLSSSMKRFYIEYEDVDETMSITNSVRVNKELIKYNRLMPSWKISCSYNQEKKLFAFNFSSI